MPECREAKVIRTGHEEGREEENPWPDFQPGYNINFLLRALSSTCARRYKPLGTATCKRCGISLDMSVYGLSVPTKPLAGRVD